ncbi:hypothetical protein [Luteimonas sp. e5]
MSRTPDAAAAAPRRHRRRRGIILLLIGLLLLALALGLRLLLRPEFATAVILDQVGDALGLEIHADGKADYDIRGTPRIVLHGVHARAPGDAQELLRAERVYLSLPWSTLKSRGEVLDVERVELDAPMLDLGALARWRATRPPSAPVRLPQLTHGIAVVRGQLLGDGWLLDGIGIDIARFHPDQPLRARLTGRYRGDALQLPFDLALNLSRVASPAALGLAGSIEPQGADWRMPVELRLAAPLVWDDEGMKLTPAKLGANARWQGSGDPMAFALGAYGPLHIDADGVDWPQLALAVRGRQRVPSLDAQGRFAFGSQLDFELGGQMPAWPAQWPALPQPLAASSSPLPFTLAYTGPPALEAPLRLQLSRDATRFAGEFRLREVLDWDFASGSPLPPLRGQLVSPRMDIAGARLEGVEIEFDEPDLPPAQGAADQSPGPTP